MDKIALIKAEIERRKSELKRYYNDDLIKFRAYDEMLSFLSTLESEKPMKELEDEMDRYFETMPVFEHENIFEETFQNIARHFAKWGAEHLKK